MGCLIMKDTKQAREHGSRSGKGGSETTRHWIMAITCAGFVVIGLERVKSHLTTLSLERQRTSIRLVIFNQPMDLAIITKDREGFGQK